MSLAFSTRLEQKEQWCQQVVGMFELKKYEELFQGWGWIGGDLSNHRHVKVKMSFTQMILQPINLSVFVIAKYISFIYYIKMSQLYLQYSQKSFQLFIIYTQPRNIKKWIMACKISINQF